jgi:hypothetical protein
MKREGVCAECGTKEDVILMESSYCNGGKCTADLCLLCYVELSQMNEDKTIKCGKCNNKIAHLDLVNKQYKNKTGTEM